ncbi:MAG: hypothetical protein GWN71_32300, partial [Gammaproteobacteria bacterium]|nr:hypothetical protein [Gammaproteobacteria bacterium]
VYLGIVFGRNWPVILDALNNVNTLLLVVAGVLAVVLVFVWWKTRRHSPESVGGEGGGR